MLFRRVLDGIERDPARRGSLQDEIIDRVNKMHADDLDAGQWLLATHSLSGFGLLRSSLLTRSLCLERSRRDFELLRGAVSTRSIERTIATSIENSDTLTLRHIAFNTDLRHRASRYAHAAETYLGIIAEAPTVASRDQYHQAFAETIRGRTVALVAPTSGNDADLDAAASSDVIYQIKYFPMASATVETRSALRCDVSFYNNHVLRGLAADPAMRSRLRTEVPWLIQKRGPAAIIDHPGLRCMSVWAPTALTTATSGTLAMFDLLQFRPKSVVLHGFNFYTTRQQYSPSHLEIYRERPDSVGGGLKGTQWSGEDLSPSDIAWSFISHVPHSDFALVQRLWKQGLVVPTPGVEEVLGLTADGYARRLETMLGEW